MPITIDDNGYNRGNLRENGAADSSMSHDKILHGQIIDLLKRHSDAASIMFLDAEQLRKPTIAWTQNNDSMFKKATLLSMELDQLIDEYEQLPGVMYNSLTQAHTNAIGTADNLRSWLSVAEGCRSYSIKTDNEIIEEWTKEINIDDDGYDSDNVDDFSPELTMGGQNVESKQEIDNCQKKLRDNNIFAFNQKDGSNETTKVNGEEILRRMENAKTSIFMAAGWVNGPFLDLLILKALEGLDVVLSYSNLSSNGNHKFLPDDVSSRLLAAGVVVIVDPNVFLHTKILVIDKVSVFSGTANFTYQALLCNYGEFTMLITNKNEVTKFLYFMSLVLVLYYGNNVLS